jgi:hypothetical protein
MQPGHISSLEGFTSQTAISGGVPRRRSRAMGESSRVPFKSWVEDRQLNPNCFDSQRIDAIPDRVSGMGAGRGGRGLQHGASSPQLAWEARRRHTPCSVPIDPAWDMDNLYLRGVEEERYVKALAEFTANTPTRVDVKLHPDYVLHPRPFLPRPWLTSGRKTLDPEREFPRRGQVHLHHETYARDSGYALYISSLMAGEGDPGRFVEELRKEHKNRRAGILLSWAQVEYYHLPPGLRKTLYPHPPEDWADWECPTGMAVPLPAVVTYRGSRLIRGDPLHWQIFYCEWVLNATVRFITDAHHRGLLWRLPRRILDNIPLLGLSYLLEGSRYDVATVAQLLELVGSARWTGYEQVGALPIQRVGTDFVQMETKIPSPCPEQVAGGEITITEDDEPEEVVASGGPSGQLIPPRRSARDGEYTPVVIRLERGMSSGARLVRPSGVTPLARSAEVGGHRTTPRTGEPSLEEQDRGQPRQPEDLDREGASGSRITRISSEMRPVMPQGVDIYAPSGGYPYPGDGEDDRDSRERARQLETFLRREGRYAEFRELAGNSDMVSDTVGRVICILLEGRDTHRRQEGELRQRIVDLEVALDGVSTRDRGTSQRLRMVMEDLAAIEARCDVTVGVRRRSGGDVEVGGETEGVTRKRARVDEEEGWTGVDPRYR